jgi:hypothetical protein
LRNAAEDRVEAAPVEAAVGVFTAVAADSAAEAVGVFTAVAADSAAEAVAVGLA